MPVKTKSKRIGKKSAGDPKGVSVKTVGVRRGSWSLTVGAKRKRG